MKNKLYITVSLPYNVVKGSFAYRQYKAEQFTHSLMNEISSCLDMKGISLSKFGKILKKNLPQNLDVFVKKNRDTDAGAQLNRIFNDDNFIIAQSMELVPDANGKINLLMIPTIVHEIRHLVDSLFHPKFILREQTLAKKGLIEGKFSDYYDQEIYVMEMFFGKKDKRRILKDIEHKTKKILRKLHIEDRIDLLQTIRYNLISEKNAYKETQKYAKKLYKKNLPVYEDDLSNQCKEFMLDEKIELLKNMIFELIKKERSIHKLKLKKSGT